MAIAQRFLFHESFDGKLADDADAPPAVNEPSAGTEPVFTEAELEAVRQAAYVEGHAAGIAEGREIAAAEFRDSMDRSLSAVGERIAARLDEIAAAQSDLRARFEAGAIVVATSVVRRLAPRILREGAEESITTLVREILPRLLEEPKIVVHVPDALTDGVRARLDQIRAESRFGGEFIVLADPALASVDCRLEWTDGGVDVSNERLWAQIDAALNDFVAASAGPPDAGKNNRLPVEHGRAAEGGADGALDRQA